ncbi:MAG: DUF6569 family protein [bacterium]
MTFWQLVRLTRVLLLGALLVVAFSQPLLSARARRSRKVARPPGVAVDRNHTVGNPLQLGRLAVFPVYALKQKKVGTFVTLREAVANRNAEVREIGASSARVGMIEVVNRGSDSILILGGTIIVGGKQDRQVGEDTIISSNSSSRVKVFCVEKGRWNATRGGKATGGKFTVLEVLATQDVRTAGQYKVNQQEVWRNVSRYNRKVGKHSLTSSLLVSVNDKQLRKQRNRITAKVIRHLDGLRQANRVVGIAYAVNGKLRSVRWFAGHGIYKRFRGILLNTAATEALGSRGAASTRSARAKDVKEFLGSFRAAKRLRVDRRTYNFNDVGESLSGYRSAAFIRARKARGRRPARPRAASPVTVDHSYK